MLRSAHLAVPNNVVCIFSYEYLSETAKLNRTVKRIGESARWADLTIRLVVKPNSMSARNKRPQTGAATNPFKYYGILLFPKRFSNLYEGLYNLNLV